MSERKRPEAPRAEKVLPGVWRLRLALPWPGVPHGNVWAVAADGGIVLFDTGIGGKGRMRQFDLALGPGRLRARGRAACSSAPTPTPTTTGSRRRSSRAAGCELWMHPAWEHVRLLADDPAAALEHRIEVARQSGVPADVAGALPRGAQRRRRDRDRRDRRARPRAAARGRGRDRPRHLAGLRDAGPRALARRPPPARAQAADLRRPPARPHRPLLRPRPHAPTRSANSSRSLDEVEPLEVDLVPARPRPPLPRPRGEDRRGAAPGRRAARQGARRRSAEGEKTAFEIVAEIVGAENVNTPVSAWVLQIVLSCLDHLAILGEVEPVEGTDPQRWALSVACRRWPASPSMREVAAPPETVFEVLADHRAVLRASRRCASPSSSGRASPAPNGVGAIRVLSAVGPPLREEVLTYEEPSRFSYKLLSGLPVRDHVGTVELTADGGGTRMTYAVRTMPTVPLVGAAVVGVVKLGVKQLIDGVSAEAERRAAASKASGEAGRAASRRR